MFLYFFTFDNNDIKYGKEQTLKVPYAYESIYTQNTDLNYRLPIKDREASILPASLDIFILCNLNC